MNEIRGSISKRRRITDWSANHHPRFPKPELAPGGHLVSFNQANSEMDSPGNKTCSNQRAEMMCQNPNERLVGLVLSVILLVR